MQTEAARRLKALPAVTGEPCPRCRGARVYLYSNTAGYRSRPGIIAGQAMTTDVCNQCWGSGLAVPAQRPADAPPGKGSP